MASLGALRFFWGKWSKSEEREVGTLAGKNLIFEQVLQSMGGFIEERAPELDFGFDPDNPREIEERRFVSLDTEQAIRDLLDDIREPMDDYDSLGRLDKAINRWIMFSVWTSAAAAIVLLVFIFLLNMLSVNNYLRLIPWMTVVAIVFCGFRVLQLESRFMSIRNKFKLYEQ